MIKIIGKMNEHFIQDKAYVLDYLRSRSVKDTDYISFITDNDFGIWEKNFFIVGDDEYRVDALCTCSDISGYDLKKANRNLGTDDGDCIAIGGVTGDDTICMNIKSGEILLWLTESGEGETVHIADNFAEFLAMISPA